MIPVASFLPSAPSWSLDWDGIDAAYPWIAALRGAAHDPIHHREGDVWTHTRMVVSELVGDAEWRGLPEDLRLAAFAAALLHDVAKPATAKIEMVDGIERVHHHGHSRVGAVMARALTSIRMKTYVVGASIVTALGVGMTRVYLGLHWANDVVGAWGLGSAWAMLCWMMLGEPPRPTWRQRLPPFHCRSPHP